MKTQNGAPPDGTNEAAEYYFQKAREARAKGNHEMARSFEQAGNQHREAAKGSKTENQAFQTGAARATQTINQKAEAVGVKVGNGYKEPTSARGQEARRKMTELEAKEPTDANMKEHAKWMKIWEEEGGTTFIGGMSKSMKEHYKKTGKL